ncbi:Major facilitator superfamily domaingeneral substrate transporter [Penicillium sp. IBT 31633x]|nr:Major facilitator superfamily domaingeneral substrate transporter [Penicillium sp. IBT 31633x]
MAKNDTRSQHSELDNANNTQIMVSSSRDDNHLLTGRKLSIAFAAMLLALLLIALDQTILSTALPRIASDFNAFSQQGWVAASFVLTQTTFILFFSQVLRVYPAKYVLIASVVIFEVGSALCGAAQDVNTLIGGRALSGVGAAGILTGILQVMAQATRLEDRPTLFSLFESVFAFASIIGPLLGGALTDHATWRWCFYINLPIGGVSIVAIVLLLDAPSPLGSENYDRSLKTMLWRTATLDWIGAALNLGAVTSLILGLQWGGNEKAWNGAEVITCLVLALVLTAIFIFWERYMGDRAMVPLAIFKRGLSIYSICSFAIFNRFIYLIFTYYIPIYYQAGRHHSATKSGVDLLPLMLSVVISIVVSGQLVGRYGRYWPFLVGGPIVGSVGAGLMYTVTASASNGAVIGYQILVGNILFAMQAEFNDTPKLISQATGMVNFCQFFGGTIGLAIAEATFSSELVRNLRKYAPQAPFEAIQESPLSIYSAVSDALVPNVVRAYVKTLSIVYIIGVPANAISLVFALFISNINIKKKAETEMEAETNVPRGDDLPMISDGQPPITEKLPSLQSS